ncbi:MAG: hypothetical protein ABSG48_10075 [Geobacteraceae bacterium]
MGKGHRKGWKKEELNTLSKRQPREQSPALESTHQNKKKPLSQRLLDFIEQPLFLAPVGTLGGLLGMFFFTPILVVCGCCILLAFHRAKVVEGETTLHQVAAYLLLFAVTTVSLYGVGILVKKKIPRFPTNEELRQIVTKAISEALSKSTSITEIHNEPNKPQPEKPSVQPRPAPQEPPKSHPSKEPPTLETPELSETFTRVQLSAGSNNYLYDVSILKEHPINPLATIRPTVPMALYIKGSKLCVDTTLFIAGVPGGLNIKCNQFDITASPQGWDHNSTSRAVEVVNQDGNPVFQLIFLSPSHVSVAGIFYTDTHVVWINESGVHAIGKNILESGRWNLPLPTSPKPIFRYPAWKYPGQYRQTPAEAIGQREIIPQGHISEEEDIGLRCRDISKCPSKDLIMLSRQTADDLAAFYNEGYQAYMETLEGDQKQGTRGAKYWNQIKTREFRQKYLPAIKAYREELITRLGPSSRNSFIDSLLEDPEVPGYLTYMGDIAKDLRHLADSMDSRIRQP